MIRKILILALLLLLTTKVIGQVHSHDEFRHFRFSGIVSHTYLQTDTPTGAEMLVLPSFGIDFEYWINDKIGIGSHNDIELETFEIETEEGEFIERVFPLVTTLDVLWKPSHHVVILGGPGFEKEADKSYTLFRAGFEYEIELANHFDFSPNAFYDFRFGAFNSFAIGLGVGYRF